MTSTVEQVDFFNKVLNNLHTYEFVDTTDLKVLEEKMKKFKPNLLWLETPTNPLLKITDIAKASAFSKKIQVSRRGR
jgi:cystathionine gamma-lyase